MARNRFVELRPSVDIGVPPAGAASTLPCSCPHSMLGLGLVSLWTACGQCGCGAGWRHTSILQSHTVSYRFDWSHLRPLPSPDHHRPQLAARIDGSGLWIWLGSVLWSLSMAIFYTHFDDAQTWTVDERVINYWPCWSLGFHPYWFFSREWSVVTSVKPSYQPLVDIYNHC